MERDSRTGPGESAFAHRADEKSLPALHSRRDLVRCGVKLAFVAPVLSTLFASQAYAANYSCYPQGHVCHDSSDPEPCCPGLTCSGDPGTCEP